MTLPLTKVRVGEGLLESLDARTVYTGADFSALTKVRAREVRVRVRVREVRVRVRELLRVGLLAQVRVRVRQVRVRELLRVGLLAQVAHP